MALLNKYIPLLVSLIDTFVRNQSEFALWYNPRDTTMSLWRYWLTYLSLLYPPEPRGAISAASYN